MYLGGALKQESNYMCYVLQMAQVAAREFRAGRSDIAQHILMAMDDASCSSICKLWEVVLFDADARMAWTTLEELRHGEHKTYPHSLQKLCPAKVQNAMVGTLWKRLSNMNTEVMMTGDIYLQHAHLHRGSDRHHRPSNKACASVKLSLT